MTLPTFDAASSGPFGDAVTSETFPHTVGSGPNRYLLVGIGWAFNAATYRSMVGGSVTYNGVAMTLVLDSGPSSQDRARTLVYELKNAPSGTHNVVVTLGSGTGDARTDVVAISWSDVDQTTPILHQASFVDAGGSVVSSVGQVVVAFYFVGSGAVVSTGQTVRASQASSGGATEGTMTVATMPSTAGTTTIPDPGAVDDSATVMFELQGTSGGGGGGAVKIKQSLSRGILRGIFRGIR